MTTPAPTHTWIVLAVAVVAISAAAVLVSGMDGTHPLALATWRTGLVAVILAPWVRLPSPRDLAKIGISGVFLAVHFAAWFSSLQLTSVLHSTVLVCLAPLWIGIAEALLYKRRPSLWWWLGMAIALPCAAWLTTSTDGSPTWQGDALAALAGVAGAVYFMLGRNVRGRVGIATYGSLVCASAAAVLLPVSLASQAPLIGFSPGVWLGIAALSVGPQLLGHNGFNYALRYLPASVVTAASLLEPLGAGLLAWVFLFQPLSTLAVVAGLGSVLGVGLATLGPTLRPRLSKKQLDP